MKETPMLFYLGTHCPKWLGLTDAPLFVSRRRLATVKKLPRARGRYAVDSGGFSELSMFGRWRTSPKQYVDELRRFRAEIGAMDFCAVQDWMCEPGIREATGLSVEQHQAKTVESYLELRSLAPELPFAPVLQGWTTGDYLDHLEAYVRAGVNLHEAPVVGVGSICRRQGTIRASLLLRTLARETGLRLHAFGFKLGGLVGLEDVLHSADSLAWSFSARKQRFDATARLTLCEHPSCVNCLDYALAWRTVLLDRLGGRAA